MKGNGFFAVALVGIFIIATVLVIPSKPSHAKQGGQSSSSRSTMIDSSVLPPPDNQVIIGVWYNDKLELEAEVCVAVNGTYYQYVSNSSPVALAPIYHTPPLKWTLCPEDLL